MSFTQSRVFQAGNESETIEKKILNFKYVLIPASLGFLVSCESKKDEVQVPAGPVYGTTTERNRKI